MRLRDRYKFVLKCGDVEHVATPIYSSLKKVWEQENGEIFFREKLEGELKFDRADYEFIRSCDFGKQIDLTLYKANNKGDMEVYWKGYFRKTDCTTDINHKVISVKPKPNDRYKLISDKLNEEYDLLKHNPKMSDVSMKVRPMLQVYELGADYVNCYIGSSYFKQEVSPIYSLADRGYLHFASELLACAFVSDNRTSLDLGEMYMATGDWSVDPNQNNTYYFGLSDRDMYLNRPYRIMLKLLSADQRVYIYMEEYDKLKGWQTKYTYKNAETYQTWINTSELQTLSKLKLYTLDKSGSGTLTLNLAVEFDFNFIQIVARLLLKDVGVAEISEEDTFVNSSIYNTVQNIKLNNLLQISNNVSTEITQWGKVKDEDVYYVPSIQTEQMWQYEPLCIESWRGHVSFWIKINDFLAELDKRYTTQKTLKDWISLYEAIRVLLQAIDPEVGITHGSGSSMFLWNNTNPLTSLQNQGEMFLLQKSNATKLEYDYSANKAPITLGRILNWLKTFNVYWDIYEINGKPYMRIEHKLFYMNGGAYVKQNKAEIDLRNIADTWGGKTYAFETNNWKYEDVNNIPTTIYYKWADEVSMPFEGEAMKVVDNPYGEEHQETRNAEVFTSDIDYIFANSEKVSKDGFVVVQGSKASGDTAYAITFYDVEINGRQYHLQNGFLSVAYMQKYYMPYDMPGKQMEITGGEIIESVYTRQLRQNQVKFALPQGTAIDMYSPIATEVGIGTIATIEQDLDSEFYTATLKYDNEQ